MFVAAAAGAAACSVSLRAQSFDAAAGPAWVLPLDGVWRFHAGDNATWAQPGLDDSSWSLLRSDRDWSTQGYGRYSGMGWYRFHVSLPRQPGSISILLPHIFTSYEVYANGERIGTFGQMPPAPRAHSTHAARLYRLPDSVSRSRELTVALRVWQWPAWSRYFGGGPSEAGALIGDSASVAIEYRQSLAALHWQDSGVSLTALLQSLGALIALSLFVLRRSEREYLWFAAILACSAAAGWIWYSYRFQVWPVWLANQLRDLLIASGVGIAQFLFFTQLFKPRRTAVYWFVLACLLLPLCTGFMDTGNRIGVLRWNLGTSVLVVPLHVWIVWLLAVRAWQNYLDARVLLIPVMLQSLATLLQRLAVVTYVLDWQDRWGFQVALFERPFTITLTQAGDLLFLAAVLAILIRRFTRSRTEEERYASEFASASAVQQYLVPRQLPETRGLAICCEYRPAFEVGGDFFQVIPVADAALVVLGDVEGKGMHAGMLAAVLVGAFRTAAEFTSDPARILGVLNRALLGRGNATCIVLHLSPGGLVSAANAGHIPPYLSGKEVAMEGALPLGYLPNAQFSTNDWQLGEGESLLLITDGMVEAQDGQGRLFGFERLHELLDRNAGAFALADTAQQFGQTDDITVLSIARVAVQDEAGASPVPAFPSAAEVHLKPA